MQLSIQEKFEKEQKLHDGSQVKLESTTMKTKIEHESDVEYQNETNIIETNLIAIDTASAAILDVDAIEVTEEIALLRLTMKWTS
jgi:hypothetical protein